MKAAVLGIGTELTAGQIINKNASWISKRLKEFGLITDLHIVVPDERPIIQQSLNFLEDKCDLLFITGGLGPTTDDFTREEISAWAKLNLLFDNDAWIKIQNWLQSRDVPIRDVHKQECYFPVGAQRLQNNVGTADGFYFMYKNMYVFVLPGPPIEIEAIWTDHIDGFIKSQMSSWNIDPFITYSWDTLGKPESEIAEYVEAALKQWPELEKGYRAHLPYVEVKISFQLSEMEKYKEAISSVEKAIGFFTISRQGEDVALLLAKKMSSFQSLIIDDSVTGQFLINRLIPALRSLKSLRVHLLFGSKLNSEMSNILTDNKRTSEPKTSSKIFKIFTERIQSDHMKVTVNCGIHEFYYNIVSPYKRPQQEERRQQFFAEQIIIVSLEFLNHFNH